MHARPIPHTGEMLPVIGLGTWSTFDVGADAEARAPLAEVVDVVFGAGGRVIDSSPMYGKAEGVSGDLLHGRSFERHAAPFRATKVWTEGKAEGIAQMNRSLQRMRTPVMDLMQIHNLLDWKTHLRTLRDWKAAGMIRYIGITHYAESAFGAMETILRSEPDVDFVQLPYNVADRTAEARLLPAARDVGAAVLVMRPFAEGDLLRRLAKQPLPAWAADFGCTSWASLLLKFVLAHPAVTCPIPATSNPAHARANVEAGEGEPLDERALRALYALV